MLLLVVVVVMHKIDGQKQSQSKPSQVTHFKDEP
jgi:hypothetical protein